MKIWLNRGRYQREREIVARLFEEGFDPMEIAAAALKISRASEKQRPVATIADVDFPEAFRKGDKGSRREKFADRGGREPRRVEAGNKRKSHEPGMVRLKLNKGKESGIRPNDIVGSIARHAEIPGSVIGKIRIEDKYSYVDIPDELVEQVLKHNGNYRLGKEKFTLVKS
jgi:ATP-dependent RNA helicase DeaD